MTAFFIVPAVKNLKSYREIWDIRKLRLAFPKGPNRVDVSIPHLKTETSPVPDTLCSNVIAER
jgi:hypothetical protein